MTCQRRILDVRWYDFVPNTVIAEHTGQQSLLSSLCTSIWQSLNMFVDFLKSLQLTLS